MLTERPHQGRASPTPLPPHPAHCAWLEVKNDMPHTPFLTFRCTLNPTGAVLPSVNNHYSIESVLFYSLSHNTYPGDIISSKYYYDPPNKEQVTSNDYYSQNEVDKGAAELLPTPARVGQGGCSATTVGLGGRAASPLARKKGLWVPRTTPHAFGGSSCEDSMKLSPALEHYYISLSQDRLFPPESKAQAFPSSY